MIWSELEPANLRSQVQVHCLKHILQCSHPLRNLFANHINYKMQFEGGKHKLQCKQDIRYRKLELKSLVTLMNVKYTIYWILIFFPILLIFFLRYWCKEKSWLCVSKAVCYKAVIYQVRYTYSVA